MAKSKSFLDSKYAPVILPSVALILLIVVWEVGVKVLGIQTFVLPAPSVILGTLPRWGEIAVRHSLQTLWTTVVGFLIGLAAGMILGFIIGFSRGAYMTLYPLLIGFNNIPKVALVPLLALWFGVGTIPAIITAFTLAFFPVAVNVAVGLATVEPEMKEVLRALGANRWEIFTKVGLPHSLPYLFAAMKLTISGAFIGSVISETVASNAGLGYLNLTATSSFEIPVAFLVLLLLGIMGIGFYILFEALERYVIHWAR